MESPQPYEILVQNWKIYQVLRRCVATWKERQVQELVNHCYTQIAILNTQINKFIAMQSEVNGDMLPRDVGDLCMMIVQRCDYKQTIAKLE